MPYPLNTTNYFYGIEFTGKFHSKFRKGNMPDNNPYQTLGIPSPTWGVQDSRPNRPSDWSSEVANYYYIKHSTGSDANDYGTPSVPRKTLPYPIPAGAYIEIDGAYAELIANDMRIWGQGTSFAPIWIVGATGTSPEFNAGGQKTLVFGSYIYIADIKCDGTTSGPAMQIASTSDDMFASHHIMLNNVEITGNVTTGGGLIVVNTPTSITNNIIAIGGEIHTLGPQVDADFDAHGISLGDGTQKIWVLGMHIHDTAGSGIQVGTGGGGTENTRHIYIGKNLVNNTRQSGIWAKATTDAIVSMNIVHDIQDRCVGQDSSPSKGMGGQYRLENVWWINNTIYNCRYGIRAASTNTGSGKSIYAIGNTISTIDGALTGGACFPNDPDGTNNWDDAAVHLEGCDDRWIVDNTLYSVISAINVSTAGAGINTRVTGNIVSQISGTNGRDFFTERSDGSVTDMRNNLWHNGSFAMKWGGNTYSSLVAYQSGTGVGQNDLTGDPQFTDAANRDFTIPLASPAAGAGFTSPAYAAFDALYGIEINVDKAGTTRPATGRSIGAYEAA